MDIPTKTRTGPVTCSGYGMDWPLWLVVIGRLGHTGCCVIADNKGQGICLAVLACSRAGIVCVIGRITACVCGTSRTDYQRPGRSWVVCVIATFQVALAGAGHKAGYAQVLQIQFSFFHLINRF